MRIAALVPDPEGLVNPIYRCHLPMRELARRGHRVRIEERTEVRSVAEWLSFDVVYFWRLYNESMRRLAAALDEAGVAIVWDNDDDMTAIPRSHPTYRRAGGREGQRVLREMAVMMRHADVVTTPSEGLAVRYRELSDADVRVIENFIPEEFGSRPSNGAIDEIVVGWMAGSEHQLDVEQLRLRPAFEALLERNPQVVVASVGLGLGLASERYRQLPKVSYQELPAALSQFDIGIAPLADIQFNRGRSNVKLKEYASSGLPWLASATGPYRGLGDDEGGRLVADDDWLGQLERLSASARDRKRLAKKATKWAKGQQIGRNVGQWEDLFEEVVARRRATDR